MNDATIERTAWAIVRILIEHGWTGAQTRYMPSDLRRLAAEKARMTEPTEAVWARVVEIMDAQDRAIERNLKETQHARYAARAYR
ncbi:MAG: hypothetical protein ACREM1_02825 [Longimicrobiales bacterium]